MAIVVPSQIVRFIEKVFPQLPKGYADDMNKSVIDHIWSTQVSAILHLVDQLPEHLVSLPSDEYAQFVIAREVVRSVVQSWESGHDRPKLDHTEGLPGPNPVSTLWNLLRKCGDEGAMGGTNGLLFIKDDAKRNTLRVDVSSANQALANGEFKAATVLAGSAIEALLHTALGMNGKEHSEMDKWKLRDLVNDARREELIAENTASYCKLLIDFTSFTLLPPSGAKWYVTEALRCRQSAPSSTSCETLRRSLGPETGSRSGGGTNRGFAGH